MLRAEEEVNLRTDVEAPFEGWVHEAVAFELKPPCLLKQYKIRLYTSPEFFKMLDRKNDSEADVEAKYLAPYPTQLFLVSVVATNFAELIPV